MHPALKVPRDVGNRFALAEARFGVIEKNHRAAHALNANFKRDARAQRRLLKNQREKFAAQARTRSVRMRLDVRGQLKQFPGLRGAPFRAGEKIVEEQKKAQCV